MKLLNDSEALYEKLPDFGPDTADAIVAAFVEDRIEGLINETLSL